MVVTVYPPPERAIPIRIVGSGTKPPVWAGAWANLKACMQLMIIVKQGHTDVRSRRGPLLNDSRIDRLVPEPLKHSRRLRHRRRHRIVPQCVFEERVIQRLTDTVAMMPDIERSRTP